MLKSTRQDIYISAYIGLPYLRRRKAQWHQFGRPQHMAASLIYDSSLFPIISRLSLIVNRVMSIAQTDSIVTSMIKQAITVKPLIHPATGYIIQRAPRNQGVSCTRGGKKHQHGHHRSYKETFSPPSMTTSGVQVRCRSTVHFSIRTALLRMLP